MNDDEAFRRVANILESTTDAYLFVDRGGVISYVNRRAEEAMRRTRDGLLGRQLWDVFPEAVGTVFQHNHETAAATGVPVHYEAYYPPLEAWFEVHLYPSADGVSSFFRDISQRKHSEARLRALTRRLLEVQEQERRRVARELHDEIGQRLTVLSFALEACGRASADEAAERLAEARKQLRELAELVRDLSLRLRPTMLDDLGLAPALLWLFERYTGQTGIRVDFQHRDVDRRFPTDAETAAYRVVQEGLTNVAKHARTGEAVVRLWADGATLGVQVEDRGVGLGARSKDPTGGLSGLAERVALLGGHFEVGPRAGGGTRLTAEIPLALAQDTGAA